MPDTVEVPDSLLFPMAASDSGNPESAREADPVICMGKGDTVARQCSRNTLRGISKGYLQILVDAGMVSPGRVVLIADNSPQWLALAEACWQAGHTLIPLIPDLAVAQALAIVQHMQPDVLVLGQQQWLRWQQLTHECRLATLVLEDNTAAGLALQRGRGPLGHVRLPGGMQPLYCPDGQAACLVFHSSGSTGAAKAIVYSKATLQTFLRYQSKLFDCFPDQIRPGSQRAKAAYINILPMAHFGGLAYSLQTLNSGRTLWLLNRPEPEVLAWHIVNSKTEFIQLIPAQLKQLLGCAAQMQGHRLHYCLVMGENTAPELLQEAAATLGIKVANAYGMSECLTGLMHTQAASAQIPAGSCGIHAFGELKLVKGENQTLANPGELWVRNPTTAPCYLNQELNTAKYVDGWYRTGDCLYRDSKGQYYFQGRVDEMLVINGRNLYPHEVETLVCAHPAVDQCLAVVLGASGRMILGLMVVPVAGANISAVDVMDHYLRSGALYATPGWLMFSKQLPRLASGKLDRVSAARLLAEDFAHHGQQQVLQ